MRRLLEDIKAKSFKLAYVLYGKEDYLRKQYKDKLVEALLDPEDSMNIHYVQGKNIDIAKLIDLSETMPFLSERRVIVVEDSGFFKSNADALVSYLESPSETTVWLFVEADCDKRSKLYKAFQKLEHCMAVEFETQDANTLQRWIAGLVKKEEKRITEKNLQLFLETAGTDMSIISKELEKLFCYTLHKEEITAEDIEKICIPRVGNHIFEMVDFIALKKQHQAMLLYRELIELREPAIRILFLIARHYNILLQIKDLSSRGKVGKEMAAMIGIPPFAVNKYTKQTQTYTKAQIKKCIRLCLEADEAIKTGNMQDVMSIEWLIASLIHIEEG